MQVTAQVRVEKHILPGHWSGAGSFAPGLTWSNPQTVLARLLGTGVNSDRYAKARGLPAIDIVSPNFRGAVRARLPWTAKWWTCRW